jgi:hypothetical protein
MIYIDPALVAGALKEETARPVEIVHPVPQGLFLAQHFARLCAWLTAARSDRLARDERLLLPLMRIVRRHGMARPSAVGPSPCVAKAIQRLNSAPEKPVSLAETGRAVRGQPLPAAARLCARNGIHTACLPRAAARAPSRQLLAKDQTPVQAAMQAGSPTRAIRSARSSTKSA